MEANGAPTDSSSLKRHLGDFIDGVRHWAAKERSRRLARAEVEALDKAGVLDEVLHEFSMSRADIDDIVNVDPESPHRLDQMLNRLGLSENWQSSSALGHDVSRVCQRCPNTGACDHWLKGSAKEGYEDFCPNAETFRALRG